MCGLACTCWFTYSAIRAWSEKDGDLALTDRETVATLTNQTRQAIATLYSFDPGATARTDEAGPRWLSGGAADQYRAMFAPVRQNAEANRYTVDTTVSAVGLERVQGGEAEALVFARQTVSSANPGQMVAKNVQFDIALHEISGRWTISGISLVS
ncbi:hypothetical protein LWP59_26645 [Amycolatopsis acidiphila]|uniref:Mce-associated membrane protein n=1 Tax=Amycolatopsis acidiphila TaxID=715473 RepID=A0A558AIN5_9PSEU|nr:hypothetical protein [Amycolatopsis acidiphila]TVT24130.1 hypothetical protein FNH06_08015 [Amycolatopsis acidiphila]UIJ57706.1 hypothetical protein LWP59_26645 [Amycolatopsis acidiphila]